MDIQENRFFFSQRMRTLKSNSVSLCKLTIDFCLPVTLQVQNGYDVLGEKTDSGV